MYIIPKPKYAREWWGKSKPAVFSAVRGLDRPDRRAPKVHVYPLQAGAGHKWLYLIRHGWDWDNIDRAIKGGGLSNLPLATVCEIAVKELMEYRGKPIKGKPL